MPAGRPPKYETPEEMQAIIDLLSASKHPCNWFDNTTQDLMIRRVEYDESEGITVKTIRNREFYKNGTT
jgi:hypothetical protein